MAEHMTNAELLALGLYHLRRIAADQTAGPYPQAAQAVLEHIAELEGDNAVLQQGLDEADEGKAMAYWGPA